MSLFVSLFLCFFCLFLSSFFLFFYVFVVVVVPYPVLAYATVFSPAATILVKYVRQNEQEVRIDFTLGGV